MLLKPTTTIAIGNRGEELAKTYLEDKGLKFVEQNYRCKLGEIDLIMKHHETLVFAEVKTRKNNQFGSPLHFINAAKQQKIRNTALFYMQQNKLPSNQNIRFDALGITSEGQYPEIEWVENAF